MQRKFEGANTCNQFVGYILCYLLHVPVSDSYCICSTTGYNCQFGPCHVKMRLTNAYRADCFCGGTRYGGCLLSARWKVLGKPIGTQQITAFR